MVNGLLFMEDLFDELVDFEFYDKFKDFVDMYDRMYLVCFFSYLWEVWLKLDDDDEIEIGKI